MNNLDDVVLLFVTCSDSIRPPSAAAEREPLRLLFYTTVKYYSPFILIIYVKCLSCRKIKKPWSSSGRLPEAFSSTHDRCINTGRRRGRLRVFTNSSTSRRSSAWYAWSGFQATRRQQHSGLLRPETGSRLGSEKWGQITLWFNLMVKDVLMQLAALKGRESLTPYFIQQRTALKTRNQTTVGFKYRPRVI